jgi:hypothetical protein
MGGMDSDRLKAILTPYGAPAASKMLAHFVNHLRWLNSASEETKNAPQGGVFVVIDR